MHAGQWILVLSASFLLWSGVWALGLGFVDAWELGVEKLIVMRVFSERGCVEDGEEPGQRGVSFIVEWGWLVVEGVRAGTQKEGRVVFEDYREGH